jgi:predicted ATPase
MIDLLERVALGFEREESHAQKLLKLEGFLVQYGLSLPETLPLFATLLSLPLPETYVPLSLSSEQQKQQTLQALLTILLRISAQHPVLFVMEDLHWVDPSTLEFLRLLVDLGPTARVLTLFTFRPEFMPPWAGRAHLMQITVNRLPRQQSVEVIQQVAHGKFLPSEVVEQIVAKTDGVPLFVEELTKMVLESGLLQEREERYELRGPLPPLAIPATLHDSLMARLDRLATVKSLAQLGATLGREFSYDLLQAVCLWDEETLQRGLHQLVEAEFVYQQGLPPQATYRFKHALIQEAAYQSLLRSTRQQHHQRIAQVLEAQFSEIVETQPELVAHHYTEAGFMAQAIPYWQRAGQRAIERSAHLEAIAHLSKGLEVLRTLADTPRRARQELGLQIALGQAWMAAKGQGVPEVEGAYTRARELSQQVGETPELFPALWGLWRFYLVRAEYQMARELAEQCLSLAQRAHDPSLLLVAHFVLGATVHLLGEEISARAHLEQVLTLYDRQQYSHLTFHYGVDLGVWCLSYVAWPLWLLGYPEQALTRSHEAITLAQELAHPHSLASALDYAAFVYCYRREGQATQEWAEAGMTLASEKGLPQFVALGMIMRGWALAMQGQGEEGIAQLHQGLTAFRAAGAEISRSRDLALLAEAYGETGQPEAGLTVLAEALTVVDNTGERYWEVEIHRLKGELLLALSAETSAETETCFRQAIDIARRQQAKSLELRAAVSLGRLWQQQGKQLAAHELLAPIYDWFTEGFDTADLREARALLETLA